VRQSEAYQQEKVANAQGDVQRFLSIYEQYKLAPDVTERRLYLETMERIMAGMNKVLVAGDGKGGAIPYLPLDQLLKNQTKSSDTSTPTPVVVPQPTTSNDQQQVGQQ